MKKNKKLLIIVAINLIIFIATNIICKLRYEEVDDFILYNMYSGLDGTYNYKLIYMHYILVFILSLFYKIIPQINWHTIYLLISQFVCFTLIGYTLIKKDDSNLKIKLYTVFAGIFYPLLLMNIQYTSVASLLIITAFTVFMDCIEQENICMSKKIIIFSLFILGLFTRVEGVILIIPFLVIYLVLNIYDFSQKTFKWKKIIQIIKYYIVFIIIVLCVNISTFIIYRFNEKDRYLLEMDDVRGELQDLYYIDYYTADKEILNKNGWTENDAYLFSKFNTWDKNVYSLENMKKIRDEKKQNYNIELNSIFDLLNNESVKVTYIYIWLFFLILFAINICSAHKKITRSILMLITVLGMTIVFCTIKRVVWRVIFPLYIMRLGNVII